MLLNTTSSINLQASTRNKLSLITSKKDAIVCNIIGVTEAAKGHVAEEFLEVFLVWRDADEGLESICGQGL